MVENLIIIGGGEHAAVVAEAALMQPERWNISGFLNPEKQVLSVNDTEIEYLGTDKIIPDLLQANSNVCFICGIGDNVLRQKIVASLDCIDGIRWAIIIHPEASIASSADVAPGSVVLRRALIQPSVKIGSHSIINSGVILEHDSVLGSFTHLAPGVITGGGVTVGTGTLVGIGAKVRDHIDIGTDVIVGTGSVVVSNLGNNVIVAGIPAKPIVEMDIHSGGPDVKELCISPETTLYDAMQHISDHGAAALITDEKMRLLGLLNDGDIRSALLNKFDLDEPVETVMNRKYMFVKSGTPRDVALSMLKSSKHRLMPILDEDGVVAGLHLIDSMVGVTSLPNAVVIMAGGKGVRLRPITENIPKPMVKVAGRPILEHIILHLACAGIKTIYIAVNYLGSVIEDYFKDGSMYGVTINYLREDMPLGTGGALKLIDKPINEPLIVMNGDLITQFDVKQMIDYHNRGSYKLTIGVHDYQVEIPYGVIDWNESDKKVDRIVEKPEQNFLINGGIYVINPSLIDLIEAGKTVPITEIIEAAIKQGDSVGAHLLDGDWIDVGQHKDLAAARGI